MSYKTVLQAKTFANHFVVGLVGKVHRVTKILSKEGGDKIAVQTNNFIDRFDTEYDKIFIRVNGPLFYT